MTEVSKVVLAGSQPVFSKKTLSRSGDCRYSRNAAAALGSALLVEMPSPCASRIGLPAILPLP